jgi:cell wall-associated NlpC family hydrolase
MDSVDQAESQAWSLWTKLAAPALLRCPVLGISAVLVVSTPLTAAARALPRSQEFASAQPTQRQIRVLRSYERYMARVKAQTVKARKAVRFAYRQVGKPYQWGGAGPRSYDCSGLVMAAWRKGGLRLPHRADLQHRMIRRKVGLKHLRPGDLVFFSGDHHVGIYVGRRHFLHAPHTGARVQRGTLSGWRLRTFAGAARPGAPAYHAWPHWVRELAKRHDARKHRHTAPHQRYDDPYPDVPTDTQTQTQPQTPSVQGVTPGTPATTPGTQAPSVQGVTPGTPSTTPGTSATTPGTSATTPGTSATTPATSATTPGASAVKPGTQAPSAQGGPGTHAVTPATGPAAQAPAAESVQQEVQGPEDDQAGPYTEAAQPSSAPVARPGDSGRTRQPSASAPSGHSSLLSIPLLRLSAPGGHHHDDPAPRPGTRSGAHTGTHSGPRTGAHTGSRRHPPRITVRRQNDEQRFDRDFSDGGHYGNEYGDGDDGDAGIDGLDLRSLLGDAL